MPIPPTTESRACNCLFVIPTADVWSDELANSTPESSYRLIADNFTQTFIRALTDSSELPQNSFSSIFKSDFSHATRQSTAKHLIMAASHIPNLSTLRSAYGNSSSGRGRGRGRGTPHGNFLSPSGREEGEEDKNKQQAAAKAKIIQLTDQDASISRWSAVQAGYLHDPFAHLFTPSPAPRRLPIINRGACIASPSFPPSMRHIHTHRSFRENNSRRGEAKT